MNGCSTCSPVGTPFFSCTARSASMTLPRLHSATNSPIAASAAATAVAIGCSAAMAMNVAPNSVSARVVKTFRLPAAPSSCCRSGAYAKADLGALAAADPVGLHHAHALRPVAQGLERIEQLLGIARDVEVVHRDLALLDQRARAPAPAVDHLLVREHRLVHRIPVHDAGAPVGDAALQHPQEQPLVPAVVGRITGRDSSRRQSSASPSDCSWRFM